MENERFRNGIEKRRQILGSAYVDKAFANATAYTQPLQELITEGVWGHIWSRPGLDDRVRNLLNVALMVALDRPEELRLYIKVRQTTGASLEDIAETLLHATIYCGIPAGLNAFKQLERVLEEEKQAE